MATKVMKRSGDEWNAIAVLKGERMVVANEYQDMFDRKGVESEEDAKRRFNNQMFLTQEVSDEIDLDELKAVYEGALGEQ